MASLLVHISRSWLWTFTIHQAGGPISGYRFFEGTDLRITERDEEEFTAHFELYLEDALLFECRGRVVKDDGQQAELWAVECTCQNRSTLF